jgi:hypothetical protein
MNSFLILTFRVYFERMLMELNLESDKRRGICLGMGFRWCFDFKLVLALAEWSNFGNVLSEDLTAYITACLNQTTRKLN